MSLNESLVADTGKIELGDYSDKSLLIDITTPVTSLKAVHDHAQDKLLSSFTNTPSQPQNLAEQSQLLISSEEGGGDASRSLNSASNKGKDELVITIDDDKERPNPKPEPTKNDSPEKQTNEIEIDSLTAEDGEEQAKTVMVLDGHNGSKVYLVGTAHFSVQSQEDVARVIQKVRPNIVMVELCEQRTNILLLDEEIILREAKDINIQKIRSSVAQNGVFNGLMYLLLLNMSAHITRELGMAPGGEFRRALAEAKKIPNCLVQLGDRPIDITLQRALASLSWGQTIRLAWHLLTSKDSISAEEIEKCKQKKMLEDMLEEMAGEFPALRQVFVTERDLYLCHSLLMASSHTERAGGNPCCVVGVVGIGHMKGIAELWGKVSPSDIPPLLKIPPPTRSTKIIRASFKVICFGLVVYAGYKIIPKRWLF